MAYDVAVVGAGPAGLMAAKTAAEKGLKVILMEKGKEVSPIVRACSENCVLDPEYRGETLKIEKGKIRFTKNGFEVAYDGPLHPVLDIFYTSPRGHRIHFAHRDRRPLAFKYDKGLLLAGLLRECEEQKVAVQKETVAYGARDGVDGIEVKVVSKGRRSLIKARKGIIADGVNSRISQSLGLNRRRMYVGTFLSILYVLKHVADYDPHASVTWYGHAYKTSFPSSIGPGPVRTSDTLAGLGIVCPAGDSVEDTFRVFTTRSPVAHMFEKAKVVEKKCATINMLTPMLVPYQGNALAVGDAAGFVEVQTQAALACGFNAGSAVASELSGKEGFNRYTAWWQTAMEFNRPGVLQIGQALALAPGYTDDELDYLFSLAEDDALEGTANVYRSPVLIWAAVLRHRNRIALERPQLNERIERIANLFPVKNAG
jgi:flavin-dependent dehydrogenase